MVGGIAAAGRGALAVDGGGDGFERAAEEDVVDAPVVRLLAPVVPGAAVGRVGVGFAPGVAQRERGRRKRDIAEEDLVAEQVADGPRLLVGVEVADEDDVFAARAAPVEEARDKLRLRELRVLEDVVEVGVAERRGAAGAAAVGAELVEERPDERAGAQGVPGARGGNVRRFGEPEDALLGGVGLPAVAAVEDGDALALRGVGIACAAEKAVFGESVAEVVGLVGLGLVWVPDDLLEADEVVAAAPDDVDARAGAVNPGIGCAALAEPEANVEGENREERGKREEGRGEISDLNFQI